MERRKFLKIGLTTSLFAGAGKVFNFNIIKKLHSSPYSKLVSIKSKNIRESINAGIEILGGISKFIKKGDRVVIKPNIAWNRAPKFAANTNPEVIYEIIRLCKKAGAGEIIIFDRTCNSPKRSYIKSGIKEATEKAGGKLVYVNKVSSKLYQKQNIPKGRFLKESLVSKYILEADKIINIPVAKVHSSAGLTIALKNWMGTTGDIRGKWHFNLHNAIADYASIIKPTLTIVDAIRIMIKNGPTGGRLDYVKKKNTLIFSTDQLLADVYTTQKIFKKSLYEIKYLKNAYDLGVGEISLRRASIIEKSI